MATDTAAKRTALQARLSQLDADAERVKTKRAQTVEQLKALDQKADAKPARGKKA